MEAQQAYFHLNVTCAPCSLVICPAFLCLTCSPNYNAITNENSAESIGLVEFKCPTQEITDLPYVEKLLGNVPLTNRWLLLPGYGAAFITRQKLSFFVQFFLLHGRLEEKLPLHFIESQSFGKVSYSLRKLAS